MADDMGKIDKSEPCVNTSGYAARDGVSKYVTELMTTRQSFYQTVEGVSTAWCHHNTLKPGQIEQLMTVILKAFHLKKYPNLDRNILEYNLPLRYSYGYQL